MALKFFFEISTLARYNASGFHLYIKIGIYFMLYPITYQNTYQNRIKKCLFVQTALQSYIVFLQIFRFFALCGVVIR